MTVTQERKAEIVREFARSADDTGSVEVQVALLTESIRRLTDHLKTHRKDTSTRRGLLGQVARRAKLLRYLKRKDAERYHALVEKLGIRG